MPSATPANRPSRPSSTGAPTSAPTPKPIAAHRRIVATSRLPATAPRIVGGRTSCGERGALMDVGDGFGHAGARWLQGISRGRRELWTPRGGLQSNGFLELVTTL